MVRWSRRIGCGICGIDAAYTSGKDASAGIGGRRMIATDTTVGTTVGFYINGAWEQPEGRKQGTVTNPATRAVLASVPYATDDDVDRAVGAAHQAFLKWR